MSKLNFNPSTDIPSLSGKILLVTGGTAGLGRETILNLIKHEPARIYFSGRSQASANKLIAEAQETHPSVPVSFIQADLTSMASIKAAATDFLSHETRLDILFANAGIMAHPPGLTKDGYEIQFGTNHMGHAALVKLLLPILQRTAETTGDARIIWNTSLGYKAASTIQFDRLKSPNSYPSPIGVMGEWLRYGQSKLANLLYARAFAQRYPTITSVAVHPGVSYTGLVESLGLFNRMFVYATTARTNISSEECAFNQQWAATAVKAKGERAVESGVYYEPVGVEGELTKAGADDNLATKLWDWTQKELAEHGI